MILTLNKVGFVQNAFLHYVQRDLSISNTQNEKTKDIFTIFDNVFEFYKEKSLWDTYYKQLEYTYTRYLLCSSLKRITHIKDEKIRKELLSLTWDNLNSKFPNWKKNEILHNNEKKNLYMRSINRFTFKIYCKLLQLM